MTKDEILGILKHPKEAKAWAEGKEIERLEMGVWMGIPNPTWVSGYNYRIKPEVHKCFYENSFPEGKHSRCPQKGVLFVNGAFWCKAHAPFSRYERHGKEFYDALVKIASCDSHAFGDVVDIARAVLDKIEEGKHR